jgi:hypothetical protein
MRIQIRIVFLLAVTFLFAQTIFAADPKPDERNEVSQGSVPLTSDKLPVVQDAFSLPAHARIIVEINFGKGEVASSVHDETPPTDTEIKKLVLDDAVGVSLVGQTTVIIPEEEDLRTAAEKSIDQRRHSVMVWTRFSSNGTIFIVYSILKNGLPSEIAAALEMGVNGLFQASVNGGFQDKAVPVASWSLSKGIFRADYLNQRQKLTFGKFLVKTLTRASIKRIALTNLSVLSYKSIALLAKFLVVRGAEFNYGAPVEELHRFAGYVHENFQFTALTEGLIVAAIYFQGLPFMAGLNKSGKITSPDDTRTKFDSYLAFKMQSLILGISYAAVVTLISSEAIHGTAGLLSFGALGSISNFWAIRNMHYTNPQNKNYFRLLTATPDAALDLCKGFIGSVGQMIRRTPREE